MSTFLFVLLALTVKTKWFIMAGFAFASVISFFQINSALADRKKLNTMWKVLGVVFGIVAIVLLIMVASEGGTPKAE